MAFVRDFRQLPANTILRIHADAEAARRRGVQPDWEAIGRKYQTLPQTAREADRVVITRQVYHELESQAQLRVDGRPAPVRMADLLRGVSARAGEPVPERSVRRYLRHLGLTVTLGRPPAVTASRGTPHRAPGASLAPADWLRWARSGFDYSFATGEWIRKVTNKEIPKRISARPVACEPVRGPASEHLYGFRDDRGR